jgi:hypothetical protein
MFSNDFENLKDNTLLKSMKTKLNNKEVEIIF